MEVTCDGKKPPRLTDDESVPMMFSLCGDLPKIADNHDLVMTVAGQMIPHSGDSYTSSQDTILTTGWTEELTTNITVGDIKKALAKGANWEVKIGTQKPFQIGPKGRNAIGRFIKILQH